MRKALSRVAVPGGKRIGSSKKLEPASSMCGGLRFQPTVPSSTPSKTPYPARSGVADRSARKNRDAAWRLAKTDPGITWSTS